ncbi:MAG TPA: transglycosylase domain-containing protein [Candidatus Saccharimonadia bacterium]|nr:transglycosylase domain-containing protein [Candidatus Saccharimonadia bacterium]
MNIWRSLWHRRRVSRLGSTSGSSRLRRRGAWNSARTLRFATIGLFAVVVIGIVSFFALLAWAGSSLPSPDSVVRTDGFSTRIYDRNGNLLYDLHDNERNVPATLDQMPKYLQQATVAIEDKNFYSYTGFDPLTPLRVMYYLVKDHRIIGGSGLSQQLAKIAFFSSDKDVVRKFKQEIIAIEIERKFSKDQILQMYLNDAPYGGTAKGVGAAAEVYFNKPVQDLTLPESAILAGLPQLPSAYSPFSGKTAPDGTPSWQARTQAVLRRMREDGYITPDLEKEALAELPNMQFSKQAGSIQAPHFVFYVKAELEKMYDPALVESGGLQVTTTLDLPFQQKAQDIVKTEIANVEKFHITNGSAIVMDPNTGEILSMVGSKDYFATDYDGQFNVAVDGLRQPGSSIKPVTYLTAFRKGYTPASMIMDAPTSFPGGGGQPDYAPQNYDGKFHGPVSLRIALSSSLNIPAVKMLALVGVNNMLQTAYDMGFPTLQPTAANMSRLGLSVTLGGGEVHLIDTATAYSAFANGGNRVEPVAILKVTDKDGKVLYEHRPVQGKQVMTPEEAFLMDHILSDNSARSLTFGPNSQLNYGGKAVAVKTGTTNNKKDNWTIGWSRSTMVGVWVGNNDNSEMTNVASGVTGASPIWRKIMDEAIKGGRAAQDWVVPAGVQAVRVDAISGYPSHDGFPEKADYVLPATLPSLPDPIHANIKLCKGERNLATDVDIQRGNYDNQEFIVLKENDPLMKDGVNRWQAGIDQWIASQPADQQAKYKPPTQLCSSQSEVWVSMTNPQDQHDYPDTSLNVSVDTVAQSDIDRVEIWVNDALKETLKSKPYTTTISFPAGRYKLYAKSYSTDGKMGQTGDIHIGTGGTHWQDNASPSPSPSPSPTP